MNMFYVYIYLNSLKPGDFIYQDLKFDYEPFYVGKGKNDRMCYHFNKVKNKNKYKDNNKFRTINQILDNGQNPIIIKIKSNLTEDESLTLENLTIKKIGRLDTNQGPLTNLNDGGHKPQDNYRHTNESKNKISDGLRKKIPNERYTLVSPLGEIHENVKLISFCKEFNLDYQKIRKSSNQGKIYIKEKYIKHSKQITKNCIGWEVINKKIENKKELKLKYKLINPDGKVINIYTNQDAYKIVNDLELDFRTLNLYRNKGVIQIRNINQCKKQGSKNCQGWQFLDPKRDEHKHEPNKKLNWIITSPDNEVYQVANLLEFCQEYNLSYRTLQTFKNKGVICMTPKNNYTQIIYNTIGWECRKIS